MGEVPLYACADTDVDACSVLSDGGSPRASSVSITRVETGIFLPNNQRQHRTSRAPKDVLPVRICAHYRSPCQPLLRAFFGSIRSPPPSMNRVPVRGVTRFERQWFHFRGVLVKAL